MLTQHLDCFIVRNNSFFTRFVLFLFFNLSAFFRTHLNVKKKLQNEIMHTLNPLPPPPLKAGISLSVTDISVSVSFGI